MPACVDQYLGGNEGEPVAPGLVLDPECSFVPQVMQTVRCGDIANLVNFPVFLKSANPARSRHELIDIDLVLIEEFIRMQEHKLQFAGHALEMRENHLRKLRGEDLHDILLPLCDEVFVADSFRISIDRTRRPTVGSINLMPEMRTLSQAWRVLEDEVDGTHCVEPRFYPFSANGDLDLEGHIHADIKELSDYMAERKIVINFLKNLLDFRCREQRQANLRLPNELSPFAQMQAGFQAFFDNVFG